jgi:hypothetical protein
MFAPGDLSGEAQAKVQLTIGNLGLFVTPKFASVEPSLRDQQPFDPNEKSSNVGVFYRPLLPYQITVQDNNNHSSWASMVMLPNDGPILSLVPRRHSLVTAKTSITFDHGCPTAVSFDSESSAVAWFSLPIDMVKAFLSAPAELVQLKLNFANTNAQLSTAQLNDLTSQLNILKEQMAIQQFIQTNSPTVKR